MSDKFFEIANAIYEGKMASTGFCLVLPGSLILGTIGSHADILAVIRNEAQTTPPKRPIDAAIAQISAKMTFEEAAENNPKALAEKIVTLLNARILSGENEVRLPIIHVDASQVMAWGQGDLGGIAPAG